MVLTIVLSLMPIRLALAGPVPVLAPVADADQRLGWCDVLPGSSPNGTPWTQLAYNAGARSNRWEFRWDRIEPQAGQWDFTTSDPAVAESRQAGLEVLGIIDGTPRWATAPGQPPGNGVPRGLGRPIDGVRNLWAAYIRGLVTHYRGQVGYWEIWNEPDLHYFWNGTVADYLGLLEVAYRVIKQTDPSARVVLAGMVVPDMQFFTQLLQDAQSRLVGGLPPFDIAAWHVYGPASTAYTDLTRFRSLLTSRGFASVSVWVTEDGFPASNPAGEPRQAAYVFQSIAYALAAGAARVLVYRASDDALPKQWGMLTAAGAPRPAYTAFQVAAEYFARTQAATYLSDTGIERFVLYQPNRRVIVFWNRALTDRAVQLTVGQTTFTTVDWQGTTATARATGATVTLNAPGAAYNQGIDPANAVVGGPPQVVVEDNTLPADFLGNRIIPRHDYLPPMSGDQRTVELLNPTDAPLDLAVSAVDRPLEYQVIHLPPRTLASVDLDLLAGIDYTGAYQVSSSTPVPVSASSTGETTAGTVPSPDWYVASTPPALTLRTIGLTGAIVDITGYGRRGQRRLHHRLVVAPGAATTWAVPSAGTHSATALTLHASVPIVLLGPQSAPISAVSTPQASWYVLRPGATRLVLFNAAPEAGVVHVRLIGAPTLRRMVLRLGAHQSYVLNTHGARVAALIAGRGLVVGYRANSFPRPLPSYRPNVRVGVAAAGDVTRVDLFNPAGRIAHISMQIVSAAGLKTVTQTLGPGLIRSLTVRSATDAASGVIARSDVPVVAAPG